MRQVSGRSSPKCGSLPRDAGDLVGLKKAGLDEASLPSYRPISNLSVISKMLERLVVRQLVITTSTPTVCCPRLNLASDELGHSTETAIIHVLSDLSDAIDCDDTGGLALW